MVSATHRWKRWIVLVAIATLLGGGVYSLYPRRVTYSIEVRFAAQRIMAAEIRKELIEGLGSERFREEIMWRSGIPSRIGALLRRWQVIEGEGRIILQAEAANVSLWEKRWLNLLIKEWQTECSLAVAIAQIRDALESQRALFLVDSRSGVIDVACSIDEEGKVRGSSTVVWDPSVVPRSTLVQNMIFDIENRYPGFYLDMFWPAYFGHR